MKHIDYIVTLENNDTQDVICSSIISALSRAKKLSLKFNKIAYIQKYRDEIPADFDFPSFWIIYPDGRIKEK